MNDLIFQSKEHQQFYYTCMEACKCRDEYRRAFFFVLGASADARANIHGLFVEWL